MELKLNSHTSPINIEPLHVALMDAPVAMAMLNGENFLFTMANSAFMKLVGRKVQGQTIHEVFAKDEVGKFAHILTDVLQTQTPYSGKEISFSTHQASDSSQREFFFNLLFQPTVDPVDNSQAILLIAQDVSAQVQARKDIEHAKSVIENERENFRNLFRQTPEMVCILSGPEHLFEFVNNAHIKALGFDATGMTVREAQPESIEVHSILDEVYQSGVTAELFEIPVTLGSSLRYFNLTYAARCAPDGSVNGVMILGSEVTDQVHARQAIIRAKEEADAANSAKSNFLANMSHEIRTPIGVIMGFSELLLDDDLPREERKEFLHRIISNTKSLTRIIDDILDLAKVEAGKVELQKQDFSLPELIADVMELFKDKVQEKDIYLKLKIDGDFSQKLHSDLVRLRQILINVIGNAVKFTTKGGVQIKLQEADEKADLKRIEIRVEDTGIGFQPDQAEAIFQPFSQADDSSSRSFGGTGLGLAISKRLAEALDGEICLESCEQGKGACFLITLFQERTQTDLNESSHKPVHAGSSPSRMTQLSGIKVLVTDDSYDNQKFMQFVLQKFGAEVTIAASGTEAIEFVANHDFDLILMDIQMPGINGLETTKSLRTNGYHKPIIALTAHAMLEERAKTREAGCNAHLTKPIDITELIHTIKETVNLQSH